jgi:shikimate dehydrogenase
VSGDRPRAAVLGSPIAHSLSPVLHTAAYDAAGLDWSYTAIECDADGLPALLARVRAEPGWRGLSLTMPLKTVAATLVDDVTEDVRAIGALNTIVVSEGVAGSALHGHNTDVTGVIGALAEVGVTAPRSPVLLGAGGTARAAVAACARLGAGSVAAVVRNLARGAALQAIGQRFGIDVRLIAWDAVADVREALGDADVLVSTTPKGASDRLARGDVGWPAALPVVDVLYDPWPTQLASYAVGRGGRVAGGLSVLVHQAAEQFLLMTGTPAPMEAMRAAGERALAGRSIPAT